MDAQQRHEQMEEIFHSSYARFLSQGLELNDAVAHALLEMQQLIGSGAAAASPSSAISSHDNVKLEDESHFSQEKDTVMETLKEATSPASTSTESSTSSTIGARAAAAPLKITAGSPPAAQKSYHSMTTTTDGSRAVATCSATSMGTQLENALMLAIETDDYRVVKRLVYQLFSDPNALGAAFISTSAEKVEKDPKLRWWGIDRDQMTRVFSLLNAVMTGNDHEVMQNTFRNALEMLVTQPWNVCSTWHTQCALRFFLVLLEHPFMLDPDYLNVVGGLCRLFYYLSKDAKALIRAQWMAFYSADELHRLLDIFQQAITICLYGSRKMDFVYAACGVLAELHVVNGDRVNGSEPFATYKEFYNDAVNLEVDVVQDYLRSVIYWKKRRGATRAARRIDCEEQQQRQLSELENGIEEREVDRNKADRKVECMPERQLSEMSFCDFPFVLDAASKSKVLQIDSDLEQRARAQDAVLSRSIMNGVVSPYLLLKVRRANIVEDAMQQIVHLSTSAETLKKPLKVKFVEEEGVDEGGVQKEFFQILIRQLLDPAYGMFTHDVDTHTLWFNSDSLEATMEYELIGTLLGLAIYNAVILDVSFPHIVYKKLMGCSLGLEDLELELPELGQGLRQLLNFKGNVEEVYQRNFEYSYEVFGEVKTVDLKPGGSSISVNNDNREEYVTLYVDYMLNKSIARQYAAFHHGFHQVCNREVLSLFRWEELQLLICGSSDLDFEALEEATHYEDGFTEDSEIIRAFWVIVHALPLEDKKKLLRFATGSDRVPIRGLSNLVFVISRNGPDSDRLPTAHTCFNHLLLPEYSSHDKLKERLLLAINQAEAVALNGMHSPAVESTATATARLSACTAYVAMLPYAYTNNDVAQLFASFGKLARVLVLRDKQTRRSRGVAFVQFARAEDCANAVARMDNMQLEGMKLAVSLCRDNGRSREFAKKRKFTASQRCFECGQLGHVSYECPRNVLGKRERPVTTGGKSSRKKLKKKKKKFDLQERAHYFNDEGVSNMLAPSTGSDDDDLSISLLAYPSAATSSKAAPLPMLAPSVSAASAAIYARCRPKRKAANYFSDEDASDDE